MSPYVPVTPQLSLPFAGSREPMAEHASAEGARAAADRVGRQCLALLAAYRARGPLTDMEAAWALGVERTTINARRNELVRLGLVFACGCKKGLSGVVNTTWGIACR